jgi:hypothetical protein
MSHCNPAYFNFCEGLVKSIRHFDNDNHIILKLLDFEDSEKKNAENRLKNIQNIDLDFQTTHDKEYFIKPSLKYINDRKAQLYTNCRPFLIHDIMKEYDDDILSLCANGLVFTNLNEVKNTLKKKDFIFLERKTWLGPKSIEDVAKIQEKEHLGNLLMSTLDKTPPEQRFEFLQSMNPRSSTGSLWRYYNEKQKNLTLQEIVHLPISRVALLGTLGISNNVSTKVFVKNWKNYIFEEIKQNQKFFSSFVSGAEPDTREDDSFVRAYIKHSFGKPLTKKTHMWAGNIVDSSCTSNKIWFAKGTTKSGGGKDNKGKRYLEKLEFFRSLYN